MLCKHPEEHCCNMTIYNGKIYCDNIEGFCHLHDEFPPYTRADQIRDMSDKELAEFMKLKGRCPDETKHRGCVLSCGECWLEWLQEPVINI